MRYAALVTATAILAAGAAPVLAQSNAGSPRCAQMVDPVSCNCAIETGGTIRPDGRGWSQPIGPTAREAFKICVKRGKTK